MGLSTQPIKENLFRKAEQRHAAVWLFFRLLGVISIFVFLSLYLQLPGLIGDQGIMPVEDRVDLLRGDGVPDIVQFPSLLVFLTSDIGIRLLALGGMVASVLLVFNTVPMLSLILLWLFHMSLVVAGGPFTQHQTDILLTETLFVGMFLIPKSMFSTNRSSSRFAIDVMLLVLAKLLIFSGVMKLFGSSLWRSLEAVEAHLLTQPLPSPLAWYVSQLPGVVLQLVTVLVIGIELLCPLLLFSKRTYRIPAAWAIIFLQIAILAMGSFGLLNILTIALCVLAFDDRHLSFLVTAMNDVVTSFSGQRPSKIVVAGLVGYLVLSVGMVTVSVVPSDSLPDPVREVADVIDETQTINRLGVYAHLPKERKELTIEGRWNGSWERYRFRMKPNSVYDPPPWQRLLLPRLDLWMTDEAHRDDKSVWFTFFLRDLRNGTPVTRKLLDHVPSKTPPEAVRVIRSTYRFTSWKERQRTGTWWVETEREIILPADTSDGVQATS